MARIRPCRIAIVRSPDMAGSHLVGDGRPASRSRRNSRIAAAFSARSWGIRSDILWPIRKISRQPIGQRISTAERYLVITVPFLKPTSALPIQVSQNAVSADVRVADQPDGIPRSSSEDQRDRFALVVILAPGSRSGREQCQTEWSRQFRQLCGIGGWRTFRHCQEILL